MDERYVPGKRVRAWHRKTGSGCSLRAFARGLADAKDAGYEAARDWLLGKGIKL